MEMTNDEKQEIVSSLRIKEITLCDLANDAQKRLGDIKALREKIQKEIIAAEKAAEKE